MNQILAPVTLKENVFSAPVATVTNTIIAPVTGVADAYQLAVRDGFVGTRLEWGASLVGRTAYESYLATTTADPPLAEAVWAVAGGQQGAKGDPGDTGATGEAGGLSPGYVHSQLAAASVWTITHGLVRHPSVTVVDSAGSVVIGGVRYLSANQLTVTFSAAFAGSAYLN